MGLRHVRLTVRMIMVIVIYLAIGFAALRSSSFLWLRTVNTLVVIALLAAVLAAKQSTGPTTAYWFGFAVVGWGYYFLAFGPVESWHLYDYEGSLDAITPDVRPNLLTSDLVIEIHQALPRVPRDGPLEDEVGLGFRKRTWILHLLLTPVLACLGGIASRFLAIHYDHGERGQPGA